MVQSAMMFALGVFVSGLAWLALSAALVRRTRRLTQQRLMARISTRRAEFEAERDELRARHAVETHRLDRELSRVLDMATAHRLESDVKDRDLINLRAELTARTEEIGETQQRLAAQFESLQDLERRHAEASSALRTAQHTLQQETARRIAAEEGLDEREAMAAQRRIELTALRAENEALRATISGRAVAETGDIALPKLPPRPQAPAPVVEPIESAPQAQVWCRCRCGRRPRHRSSCPPSPRRRYARCSGWPARRTASLAAVCGAPRRAPSRACRMQATSENRPCLRRRSRRAAVRPPPTGARPSLSVKATPETRFFEALAEIRALKRAASQPGE